MQRPLQPATGNSSTPIETTSCLFIASTKNLLKQNSVFGMYNAMDPSENWSISCLGDNEELEPNFDELDTMYQRLAAGETLELNWKCCGRRQPTPTNVAKSEIKEDSNADS